MKEQECVPVVGEKPKADFAIGGGWGNCITFAHKKQFEKQMTDDSRYTAYGFKSFMQKKPKVGSTLVGEFEKSWIVFEVVEFRREDNPDDMFWIELKPIDQVLKIK